jgi:hypothetical protein
MQVVIRAGSKLKSYKRISSIEITYNLPKKHLRKI